MEAQTDRLPLVIGVTGHRDLRDQDLNELEQKISAIVAELRRDYLGNDGETPIFILSALAEGADRLAVRVALAQGARLIAPMPMPVDEYRRDFEPGLKAGNIAEFDELLAQAVAAPVMPFTPGNSLEGIRTDHARRNEQYRAVGLFITQRCHVLLALWDGDEKDQAVGGTAEVVTFKRGGIPLMVSGSPRASLDASEIGPVLHVVTPRNKPTSQVDKVSVRPWGRAVIRQYRGRPIWRFFRGSAAWVAKLFRREFKDAEVGSTEARRELESWERFAALIQLTRQFNIEAAALRRSTDGAQRLAKSRDSLFTNADTGMVDETARSHAVGLASLWCSLFAVADILAQQRQAQFKRYWRIFFSVGYLAFFCFAIANYAGTVRDVVLAVYSLCFLIIAVQFVRARVARYQERYLDYRALAEALRVAVYWKLLGIGSRYLDAKADDADHRAAIKASPVGVIADAYPIKQPSELVWVKVCLRTLEKLERPGRAATGIDAVGHTIARRCWVRGQYEYFKKQGFRNSSVAQAIGAFGYLVVVLSPFVVVPLLIMGLLPAVADLDRYLLLFMGLLAGTAAAFSGYGERLAFTAHARHYDRMHMLFGRALDLLPEEIDAEAIPLAHALYAELGIEAMKESAEWVAIYRQRPIRARN